jgi:hypothetical protein
LKKIFLKFRTPKELWEFKVLTQAGSWEIDMLNCTLFCDCGDAEIELAVNGYRAVQVEPVFSFQDGTLTN